MFGSPVYNAIIFYIIIMVSIILLKPSILYSNKTKRFKSFGCEKGQTLMSLPIVATSTAITLYFIFLVIDLLNNFISKT